MNLLCLPKLHSLFSKVFCFPSAERFRMFCCLSLLSKPAWQRASTKVFPHLSNRREIRDAVQSRTLRMLETVRESAFKWQVKSNSRVIVVLQFTSMAFTFYMYVLTVYYRYRLFCNLKNYLSITFPTYLFTDLRSGVFISCVVIPCRLSLAAVHTVQGI